MSSELFVLGAGKKSNLFSAEHHLARIRERSGGRLIGKPTQHQCHSTCSSVASVSLIHYLSVISSIAAQWQFRALFQSGWHTEVPFRTTIMRWVTNNRRKRSIEKEAGKPAWMPENIIDLLAVGMSRIGSPVNKLLLWICLTTRFDKFCSLNCIFIYIQIG